MVPQSQVPNITGWAAWENWPNGIFRWRARYGKNQRVILEPPDSRRACLAVIAKSQPESDYCPVRRSRMSGTLLLKCRFIQISFNLDARHSTEEFWRVVLRGWLSCCRWICHYVLFNRFSLSHWARTIFRQHQASQTWNVSNPRSAQGFLQQCVGCERSGECGAGESAGHRLAANSQQRRCSRTIGPLNCGSDWGLITSLRLVCCTSRNKLKKKFKFFSAV